MIEAQRDGSVPRDGVPSGKPRQGIRFDDVSPTSTATDSDITREQLHPESDVETSSGTAAETVSPGDRVQKTEMGVR